MEKLSGGLDKIRIQNFSKKGGLWKLPRFVFTGSRSLSPQMSHQFFHTFGFQSVGRNFEVVAITFNTWHGPFGLRYPRGCSSRHNGRNLSCYQTSAYHWSQSDQRFFSTISLLNQKSSRWPSMTTISWQKRRSSGSDYGYDGSSAGRAFGNTRIGTFRLFFGSWK